MKSTPNSVRAMASKPAAIQSPRPLTQPGRPDGLVVSQWRLAGTEEPRALLVGAVVDVVVPPVGVVGTPPVVGRKLEPVVGRKLEPIDDVPRENPPPGPPNWNVGGAR